MPTESLESTGTTLDGTLVTLRPIRPEDGPVLQDLFGHMSLEDVRLRFFAPMRELSHALAARLSHLEYGREMALVAQHDGVTLGVARYSADSDRLSAEFAVAVRSDWHWRGVGHLLMTRLIELAQQSGIGELVGVVLHQNKLTGYVPRAWLQHCAGAERRDRAPGSKIACSGVARCARQGSASAHRRISTWHPQRTAKPVRGSSHWTLPWSEMDRTFGPAV
jgi:GNAT superfamily N-acetyltransferase